MLVVVVMGDDGHRHVAGVGIGDGRGFGMLVVVMRDDGHRHVVGRERERTAGDSG